MIGLTCQVNCGVLLKINEIEQKKQMSNLDSEVFFFFFNLMNKSLFKSDKD